MMLEHAQKRHFTSRFSGPFISRASLEGSSVIDFRSVNSFALMRIFDDSKIGRDTAKA